MSIGKKVLFGGVGLLLCASLALAESVRVKSTNVNLRSAPMATAKIIGKMPQGKILEVVEVSGTWTRITDGRVTGWVNSALVERVAEAPAAASSAPPPTRSSESASSAAPARSSRRSAHRAAASEDKPLNLGLDVSYQNNSANLGFGGRIWFTPAKTMPALRIMGAVDIFPMASDDLPTLLDITGDAVYVFRDLNPEFKPYVGAGIVYAHASGASSTKLDIMGGVTYKERFFGDLRIVLADGTPVIISAGIRF